MLVDALVAASAFVFVVAAAAVIVVVVVSYSNVVVGPYGSVLPMLTGTSNHLIHVRVAVVGNDVASYVRYVDLLSSSMMMKYL